MPRNAIRRPALDKPDLVVIVGAGASAPCGIPKTDELTQYAIACLPELHRHPVEIRPPLFGGATNGIRFRPAQRAFALGQVLQRALRGSYDQVTFELILHALESLESFSAAFGQPASLDNWRPVLTAFAEYTAQYQLLYDGTVLSAAREILIRTVHKVVGDACGKEQSDTEEFARVQQSQFFRTLSEQFRLIVLNLNYGNFQYA